MSSSEAATLGLQFIGKFRQYISIHANREAHCEHQGFLEELVSVLMFSRMTVLKPGSNRLTGISLGQTYAYIRWFPNERRLLRTVVSVDSSVQPDVCLFALGIDYLVTIYARFLTPWSTHSNPRAINLFYTLMSLGISWQQFILCRRKVCLVGMPW